ncbi:unnamed protein product [Lactuca saligna]|uniref:Uncharacterized protein n=1 Tax=Lactuca saligna TaxID=75948 RepID=A0AA35YBY8_LACSI|nr:unnamed protein product [Lactuca saligna]
MWHIHEYEVKSDVLFLPDVIGPVERQDREKAPKTYGTIGSLSRLQNPFVGATFQSSLKPRNVNCLGYLGNKFPRKPQYDIIPRAKKNDWISHGIRFSQSFGENVEILWKNMGLRSALLGTYEDNRFKSESKKPYLKSIGSLNLGGGPELEKKLKYTEHVCSGVILGKELVNAPPNVLTPEAEKIASTIDCDKLSDIGSEYEGSAIVHSQLFSHYFGDCPVIHAQGRTHPVPTYFLEDIHDSVDYKLASDSLAS